MSFRKKGNLPHRIVHLTLPDTIFLFAQDQKGRKKLTQNKDMFAI